MGIPVPVYVGQNIKATLVGRQIREVTCEHCGQQYVYFIKAIARGEATNHYYLDEEKAKSRALRAANYELQVQLRDAHLPVWCPDCGRYQRHMLQIDAVGFDFAEVQKVVNERKQRLRAQLQRIDKFLLFLRKRRAFA